MQAFIKHTFILCFSFFFLLHTSYAQEKVLRKSSYAQKTYPLIDSAKRYATTNPKKAFSFIESTLPRTIKYRNKLQEGRCYQTLGLINANMEQYDLAEKYFKKALLIFEKERLRKYATETMQLLAETKEKEGAFDDAVEIAEEAEAEMIQQNTAPAPKLKKVRARSYSKKGDLQKAAEIYEEILVEEKQHVQKKEAAQTAVELADIYVQQKQFDKASQNIADAEDIARKSSDTATLINTLKNKGQLLRAQGKLNEEMVTRKEQLLINEQLQDSAEISESQYWIADIMIEQNNTDEAIQTLEKSIAMSDRAGNKETKSKALKKLSQAYLTKGDPRMAYEVYKKYAVSIDEIYKKREEKLIGYIKKTKELNRKIQRIDILEKDLNLAEKTVELLNLSKQVNSEKLTIQRRINYGLSATLILLAIAAYFVYKSLIAKRQANQLLALKSLRSQMNPHFIFNALNSVNNYIAQSDERSANKYLADFSKLMRTVMENSKHDFIQLSQEIEIISLYMKLEHSRFPEKFSYDLSIETDIDYDNYYIPPMLIQPYIENAVWHGLRYKEEKGLLKVSFSDNETHLQVVIEDNGIGRKKSKEIKTANQKKNKSTGLKNIENRIKIINQIHKLTIKVSITDLNPATGEGTRVTIEIPPHQNEKE